nr:hypothetical protein [Tanacetum cinerariifolium]
MDRIRNEIIAEENIKRKLFPEAEVRRELFMGREMPLILRQQPLLSHSYPHRIESEMVHDEMLSGANNDLNVLYRSNLCDDVLDDVALECPFTLNGHTYN